MKELDFMGKRKIAIAFSLLVIFISIGSMLFRGMALGVDFTGGTLIEVAYKEAVELRPVRNLLEEAGFEDAIVQHFGESSEVLVRLPPQEKDKDKIGRQILQALNEGGVGVTGEGGSVELRRIEFVGPQVGDELRDQSGLAMMVAMGFMLVYVGFRFQLKFAIGAVTALFHDVIIVLGAFSLLGLQFDLTVLAAVLAVIGYSLNDTIVVSDRIRENFRKLRKGSPEDIINASLNQTLGRTLVTSLTTLLVLAALFVFGGELIKGFSVALIIGVTVGTYSSIYVASNVLLAMGICKEDFIEVLPENVDEMP